MTSSVRRSPWPASSFTNANKNSWEDLWRNAAMQKHGLCRQLYDGMVAYANKIKTDNAAGWAYTIFVTKYPKMWFAYEWGNHVVMDFGVDGWGIDNFNLVVAHETGHVFGCPDEYRSSGCNCTQLGGRYQIANGNCQPCATNFVPCLMCSNSQAVCDYTRGHLGWNELAVQSRGTTTLKGTWTFDFDTGMQGSPTGSDIWWEQVNNCDALPGAPGRRHAGQSGQGQLRRRVAANVADAPVHDDAHQRQQQLVQPVDGGHRGRHQDRRRPLCQDEDQLVWVQPGHHLGDVQVEADDFRTFARVTHNRGVSTPRAVLSFCV